MVNRLGGAAAGLSHFVGEPVSAASIGNLTAGFVNQLGQTELGNLLDMPNDELMQAGNGGFHASAPAHNALLRADLRVGQTDGRRNV
jgi:hypothetical protein